MTSLDFFEKKARECGFVDQELIREMYSILHDKLIPKKGPEFKFNEAEKEEPWQTRKYLLLTADTALKACFLYSQFGFILKLDRERNKGSTAKGGLYYYNLHYMK